MADYRASATVEAPLETVFGYLSDVHNLPDYNPRMASAEPRDGEAVEVTAVLDPSEGGDPDAGGPREVQGEAWFRVDDAAHTISWGSEGPNGYHGQLSADGDDRRTTVTVTLTTTRADGPAVQRGLQETVDTVRARVEG